MGFLVGIEVDNGKGGRRGEGEDEGVIPTVRRWFVGCSMMREDGVLAKKRDKGGSEEGNVIGSSGLRAERSMLRGGRVGERRVGLLQSYDIRARVGRKRGDNGFGEVALEIEGEEGERKNCLLSGIGWRRRKWFGCVCRGMGTVSTRARHESERRVLCLETEIGRVSIDDGAR